MFFRSKTTRVHPEGGGGGEMSTSISGRVNNNYSSKDGYIPSEASKRDLFAKISINDSGSGKGSSKGSGKGLIAERAGFAPSVYLLFEVRDTVSYSGIYMSLIFMHAHVYSCMCKSQ